MEIYLSGEKLYGDDFSTEEILKWFDEEKEAYAQLETDEFGRNGTPSVIREEYVYTYHGLNTVNGYNKLPKFNRQIKVLSIGGAYGDELIPFISSIESITIIESSIELRQENLAGIPINYINPSTKGEINLPSNQFDLITCFGVLHHIPNVSYVCEEMVRVLKPGGYILIREPIVSMGDWRFPRAGLTKNERGIPLDYFRTLIKKLNVGIVSELPCCCRPFDLFFGLFMKYPYNSKAYARIDGFLSKVFAFNYLYHSNILLKKIRPSSIYYVLEKK